MYIAINHELFKQNPTRAMQFAIRKETAIDILIEVYSKHEYPEQYTILYIS